MNHLIRSDFNSTFIRTPLCFSSQHPSRIISKLTTDKSSETLVIGRPKAAFKLWEHQCDPSDPEVSHSIVDSPVETIQSNESFSVECIGYYKRQKDCTLTLIDANQLPRLKTYSELSKIQNVEMTPNWKDYEDEYAGENYMESLLNWLHKKDVSDSFQLITFRQLLRCVAENDERVINLEAHRINNKIFIFWHDYKSVPQTGRILNQLAVLRRFSRLIFTRSDDDVTPSYKGVFRTTFGENLTVLYSGDLNGQDEHNEHVKISMATHRRVTNLIADKTIWQCLLSNIHKVVVGYRKGNVVESICVFPLDHIIQERNNENLIENGKKRVKDLLEALQRELKFNGDNVVMERNNGEWSRLNRRCSLDFRNLIDSLFH